jgi:hypothetical protein
MRDHFVVPEPQDFSLVLGGPLYQLFRRTRLADDALQLLHRRVFALTLLAWLPLLLLSVMEGYAWVGASSYPSSTTSRLTHDCCWHCHCCHGGACGPPADADPRPAILAARPDS